MSSKYSHKEKTMKTSFKPKLRKFIAVLIALTAMIAALCAVMLTANAATSDLSTGKTFSAKEVYALEKNITPNGSITFEAELYIPEAYRTGRAGFGR